MWAGELGAGSGQGRQGHQETSAEQTWEGVQVHLTLHITRSIRSCEAGRASRQARGSGSGQFGAGLQHFYPVARARTKGWCKNQRLRSCTVSELALSTGS